MSRLQRWRDHAEDALQRWLHDLANPDPDTEERRRWRA